MEGLKDGRQGAAGGHTEGTRRGRGGLTWHLRIEQELHDMSALIPAPAQSDLSQCTSRF